MTSQTVHSKPAVSPARAAAFDILLRVERESSYASELLHSAAFDRLSSADHALATELVMGVLRWRSRLDDEIALVSSQPICRLDLEILIALRVAIYQFFWLDRIPQRAALHESVELVKRARKHSAAAFVNAVLRKLLATPRNRAGIEARNEERNEETNKDGNNEAPQELARAFAHPLWLVERWCRDYGPAIARKICQYNQSVPTTSIRLRTSIAQALLHPEQVEQQLKQEGVRLAPGCLLASARRVQAGDVTKTEAFCAGRIAIQDEASQLVAALVGSQGAQEATRILDCCAAPGMKSLAMADENPAAAIVAIEIHPHRARLLEKLVQAQASRVQIVVADALHLPLAPAFHRVLVDVPCSGTGTLARNPEIKWRLKPDDLAELQARQVAILRSAMAQVAHGGSLVYSTCSLEKEENEDVVEQALFEHNGPQNNRPENNRFGDGAPASHLSRKNSFRLRDCRTALDELKKRGALTWADPASLSSASLTRGPYLRTVPGVHSCDGFFAAILERV